METFFFQPIKHFFSIEKADIALTFKGHILIEVMSQLIEHAFCNCLVDDRN